MDTRKSKEILSILKKTYGEVAPGLAYKGLYQLTVSVVLSAQTTDRQVNEVTPMLFSKYTGFSELARAKQSDVEKIIRPTGFYRAKARHIIALSMKIMKDFGGKVPQNLEELQTLPGVGRKSANVILSMGFGIPAIAVDTHVGRIARRLGYTESENPLRVEESLMEFIPEKEWTRTHLLFITHGRKICSARSPLCEDCPLYGLCPSAPA